MLLSKHESELKTQLEDLAALRNAATDLQRLRGVISQRHWKHPNAQALENLCNQLAQKWANEFDRGLIALLNQAVIETPESDKVDNGQ